MPSDLNDQRSTAKSRFVEKFHRASWFVRSSDPVADDRAKARSMLRWDVEIESYGLKCSIPCETNQIRSKVSDFIRSELYEIKTYMRPSCISICMKLIRKRSFIGAELTIFTFTTDEFTGIHILFRNQKPSFLSYKLVYV